MICIWHPFIYQAVQILIPYLEERIVKGNEILNSLVEGSLTLILLFLEQDYLKCDHSLVAPNQNRTPYTRIASNDF